MLRDAQDMESFADYSRVHDDCPGDGFRWWRSPRERSSPLSRLCTIFRGGSS